VDKTDIHPDWVQIEALGGPAKVAERLGWHKDGGLQRIQNWKRRGVPALVKLEHAELFLPGRPSMPPAPPPVEPPAAAAMAGGA